MMENLTKFIVDTFNFTLTDSQIAASEKLNIFFKGNSNCFILKGYAGTGKTTLLYGISQFLDANNVTYKLMAPTGRAAKIIADKTKISAYTIHKSIYSINKLEELKETDEAGSETFKYFFDLVNNNDPTNTVYIVDEASMVSDKYSEGEFFRFGSGRLLDDLLQYIRFTLPKNSRKVIFVGDSAQLPPVNMNFSPALDPNYLMKTDHKLTVEETVMEDVIRHHQDSGILSNATDLRNQISKNSLYKIKIKTNYPDIVPIDHGGIVDKYLEYTDIEKEKRPIIIAATNKSVQRYNNAVRDRIYPEKNEIQPGDIFMVVRNNYKYSLLNGEFGEIKNILSDSETIPLTLKKTTGAIKVDLKFKSVTVEVLNMNGEKIQFDCKLIENLLDSKGPQLTNDEQRALYVLFRIRMKEKGIEPNTNPFKEAIKNDPYFNALLIKYGYAVTCHKAQGGEWDTTIIDYYSPSNKLKQSYFRWCYTALTRSKNKMFCVSQPDLGVGERMKGINVFQKEENIKTKEVHAKKNEIEEEFPPRLFFHNDFQKGLYSLVRSILKNTITVSDIKHLQYVERYEFETKPEKTTIDFIYNSKSYVTKINCNKKGTGSEEICEQLQKITASPVSPSQGGKLEANFPEEKPYLFEFYQNIKKKLSEDNIEISNITRHQYLEVYTFKRGKDFATIKFYYNNHGIFTSFEPDREKSNADDLIYAIGGKV